MASHGRNKGTEMIELVVVSALLAWALWYFRDGWQERAGDDWGGAG